MYIKELGAILPNYFPKRFQLHQKSRSIGGARTRVFFERAGDQPYRPKSTSHSEHAATLVNKNYGTSVRLCSLDWPSLNYFTWHISRRNYRLDGIIMRP